MINRYIRAIAGAFVVLSVLMAYFININWIWFTLFVGINLFQSAFTKWCLMENILKSLGVEDKNN